MLESTDAQLLGLPLPTLFAAALASVLCGLVGTFVVLRRLVALGGGIAHAAFGGIGLAVVAGLDPRWGAAAVALGAAVLLTRIGRERSDRQDATIGVLWAVGMAVGMILLAGSATGDHDVESYLFGDIAAPRPGDLLALGCVAAAVVAAQLVRGRELVAIAFDPEHARLQGVQVGPLSLLLMTLVALAVVALLQLVGVVLAIALLAIPPLVALRLCRSLPAIVAVGATVAFAIQVAGLALARSTAWPPGPAIVVLGALVLLATRFAPRPGRAAAAMAAVMALVVARAASAAEPTSLEWLGTATLAPVPFAEAPIGGLSGLAYRAEDGALFALSDDRGERAPSRIFRLSIDLADGRLDDGDIAVVGRTWLRTRDGAFFEPGVLDPEGIALAPDGGFIVSTEGMAEKGIAPAVIEFDAGGRERARRRLSPRFEPDPLGRERGARDNLGFEALTLTPGGLLVAGLENALVSDGPAADVDRPSFARLLVWPLADHAAPARELAYRLDPLSLVPPSPEGFRVNGLTELLALSDSTFFALEREFAVGVAEERVRLFHVALDGATDVTALDGLDRAEVVAARRTELVDLSALGVPLENFEALAFGPTLRDGRRTLLLGSDDNFDPPQQVTRFHLFALDDRSLPIAAIQGAAHRSPLEGRWVLGVEGVVTATDRRGRVPGFAIESPLPDDDRRTSEALWVQAKPPAGLTAGDRVRLTGRIAELAANDKQLPVTTLIASGIERLEPAAGRLPAPQRLGVDLRMPAQVDGDALADFRPERDAIDLWESVESMRVEIPAARVVGPTLSYGEAVFVADDGGAEGQSDAGGQLLLPGGPALDRVIVGGRFLRDVGTGLPDLAVGARVAGPLVGVVDYGFSNYKLQLLTRPEPIAPGDPCSAKSRLAPARGRVTIATLNVENLSVAGAAERFERFGRAIVERLGSPAIVALEEIQDDSGPAKGDGIVSAEKTLAAFVAAIEAAGGPRYRAISIDPELDREGGQPGGNIRVVLLVDPARVGFTPRGTPHAHSAATVVGMDAALAIEPNPARVAPLSPAFTMTSGEGVRRSLVVQLEAGGRSLFVIANHWSSKYDDEKTFGAVQPPRRPTDAKRLAQSQVVRELVDRLLAGDPEARIVVLGDFNDFPWTEPIERLSAPPMTNLTQRVPSASRYTYNFEGVSQTLDGIVVSRSLAEGAEVEIVHLNTNCPDSQRISDHDPIVASLPIGGGSRSKR